jgi:hypothetical protein
VFHVVFFCDQQFDIALRGICLLATKSTDVHHLNWCLILFRQFLNALDLNAYCVSWKFFVLIRQVSLFAVPDCCLEDEGARKEALGEAREARRSSRESS